MIGVGGSISGGGRKQRTTTRGSVLQRTPGEVSSYFMQMLEDLGGGMLGDEDWMRLEKALYERPAGRLREEQAQMEPRLYSEMSKRGVGDAPEVVSKNVGEAMIPFSRRFADIASGATSQRYQMELPYKLGMGNLWYQGMGRAGPYIQRTKGKSFELFGKGSVSAGFGGGGQ